LGPIGSAVLTFICIGYIQTNKQTSKVLYRSHILKISKIGMVFTLAEGGIDKTPKNAQIPDNISLILSLYDSLP